MIRKPNGNRGSGSKSPCWCHPEPHTSVQVGDLKEMRTNYQAAKLEPSRLSEQIVALGSYGQRFRFFSQIHGFEGHAL